MKHFILKNKIILLTLSIIGLICLFCYLYILGLASMWSLNTDDRPYFITTEPMEVKNIKLPIGTKIIYEKKWSLFRKKSEQEKPLNEEDVETISMHSQHDHIDFLKTKEDFPVDSIGLYKYIEWARVPVRSIYLSADKKHLVISPDFRKMSAYKKTKFSQIWQNCDKYAKPFGELYINLKNINDWSFNKENIIDIYSCSDQTRGETIGIQYHNDKILDTLYQAMLEVKIKD